MGDPSDDLDQLLDSALDDFGKIDLGPPPRSKDAGGEASRGKLCGADGVSGAPPVQGLGPGLSDLRSSKKGKQKVAVPKPKDAHVSEALEKLTQQTREAVRGMESALPTAAPGGELGSDEVVEDFVRQFEQFSGTQDMESMVETMMRQLLSKEILYEPMKEIAERYPKWLEEHKTQLNPEEYGRYCHQYDLIKNLNEVYETDPANFTKIVDLMQKMQECGQPPNDIVQELAPGLDFATMGEQLSPEMLDSNSNCCIM